MGYRIFSMRDGQRSVKAGAEEFFRAAEQAKEAIETMHELACEMEDLYGERSNRRNDWDEIYGERRRRDSRGRYM